MRPDHRVIRYVRPLGFVAAFDVVQVFFDALEVLGIVASEQATVHQYAVEMIMANVVGAAFEQGDGHGCAERVADGRQIAFKELILQGFGAR